MENFYTLTIYLRWRLLTSLLIISWDTDQDRSLADFFFFEVSKNTCSSVVSSILFCSKTFFFFLKKIFIYFWLCWVLVAVSRLLSSCGTQVPECTGSVVVVTGLVACRILVPGPGIEPLSPALEGGLVTTGPLVHQRSLCSKTLFQTCNFSVKVFVLIFITFIKGIWMTGILIMTLPAYNLEISLTLFGPHFHNQWVGSGGWE